MVDGIGEFDSTTLLRATAQGLNPVARIPFPHSLGFLWEKLSAFLGFDEYDAAKVMGLAAYGDEACFRDAFATLVTPRPPFTVDDEITRFRSADFAPLERLLGLSKRDEPVGSIDTGSQPYADVAAALQAATDEVMLALSAEALAVHPRNLCLSGGAALNCVSVGQGALGRPRPAGVRPASRPRRGHRGRRRVVHRARDAEARAGSAPRGGVSGPGVHAA